MELLGLIEIKRKELTEVLQHKGELETEIHNLQQKLEREPEKLNNHGACLNPIKFAERNCPDCHFYRGCVYEKKSDYLALKNLHTTGHRKAQDKQNDTGEGNLFQLKKVREFKGR